MRPMKMDNTIATTKTLVIELVDELAGALSVARAQYVRDIIDHAEYGDALENIVAILLEGNFVITASQLQSIEHLEALMGAENVPLVAASLPHLQAMHAGPTMGGR